MIEFRLFSSHLVLFILKFKYFSSKITNFPRSANKTQIKRTSRKNECFFQNITYILFIINIKTKKCVYMICSLGGEVGGNIGDWELVSIQPVTHLSVRPGYGASRKFILKYLEIFKFKKFLVMCAMFSNCLDQVYS